MLSYFIQYPSTIRFSTMEIYYVTIYITHSRFENLQFGWRHLRARSVTEVGVGSDRDPTPCELKVNIIY